MQRGGGRTGRPLGHLTIDQLEAIVGSGTGDGVELRSVIGELAYRKSPRAIELRSRARQLAETRQDGSAD